MMKKIVILLIFTFAVNSFAITIDGIGKAVIVEKNLKKAEDTSLKYALIDAIYNYFKTYKKDQEIPDINEEFFKFIKSYKIVDRRVENYTVVYNIEADIDEFAIDDATYFLKKIVHSVVYSIEMDRTLFKDSPLREALNKIFSSYNFSTRYQEDFEIETPEDLSLNDKLTNFGNSRANYYFIFHTEPEFTNLEQKTLCKLTLVTKIYTKKEALPTIKVTVSELADNETEALKGAFEKAGEKTIQYVRDNLIKIPDNKYEEKTFDIIFLNFNSFLKLNNLLTFLKEKGFIESFYMNFYSMTEAKFEIVTKFTLERLSEKIKEYDSRLIIESENNELIITFL